jgi:hypothetical protein
MKSQVASTTKGSIEYILFDDDPKVLARYGTSSDRFSTDGVKPLVNACLPPTLTAIFTNCYNLVGAQL